MICILSEDKKEVLQHINPLHYGACLKLTEQGAMNQNGSFHKFIEYLFSQEGPFYKQRVVWAGDYADCVEDNEYNHFNMCDDKPGLRIGIDNLCNYKYLVNDSKKEYLNISKEHSNHPIVTIMADGNGKGGGDYYGEAGQWKMDRIYTTNEKPKDMKKLDLIF